MWFLSLCLLLLVCPCRAAVADNPYLQSLIAQAHTKHLADQPYWRRLLHDRRNLFGYYESEVDDPHFFLDSRGRKNPSAELDATLTAFFEPPVIDSDTQHPQCRFPARYAWLKDQLGFDNRLQEQACPRFEQWRDSMNAASVTVIFASYYMNNPSSMYGHSFLRLNGKGHTASEHLLDYTVNYAADVNTHNGILFAIYGLTGGYRGRFSTMPYYAKVQEYNNLESRDLWEYALTLDPAAVDRMLRHLWELGNATLAYYFLNRNCSYELLPVLEVADPSLHLIDRFWFKAIPTDTLRMILQQPGLVSGVVLRPSHVSKMLAARERLSPEEIKVAEKLVKDSDAQGPKDLAPYAPERKAAILDSAYDLFRYRTGFSRDQPSGVQEQDHRLLVWRNELGPVNVTQRDGPFGDRPDVSSLSPDHGHKTGRIGLSYGFTNHSHFEELSLRTAVHDQDDPPLGYIPGSQLQMFHLRMRYDNDRKTAYVQQFTLVDLRSYSPWDRWVHHPSWEVNTGLNVANDLPKDPENSLYYGLNGGSGFSFHTPLSRDSMIYALARADMGLGATFRDNYRIGGGGSAGLFFDIADFWHVHFDFADLQYALGNPGPATKLTVVQGCRVAHDVEFRATLERQNTYKEVLLSLLFFL